MNSLPLSHLGNSCLCLGCLDPSHQEALWMSPGDSSWIRSEAHSVLLSCTAHRASLGLGLPAKRSKWILPFHFLHSIASSPVRAPKCSGNKNVSSTIPPPLQANAFLSSPRLLSLSLVLLYSSPSGFCTQAFLGSHYNHSGVASLCSALSTLNYTLCTSHVAA